MEEYHSIYSLLVSILVIAATLFSLFYFSQELFNKESPSVNLSSKFDPHPGKITYFNNFEFMIGIQNHLNNMVIERNEKYYTPYGNLLTTVVNETGTFNINIEIKLEACEIALQDSENYPLFAEHNLEGYYCISRDQPYFKNGADGIDVNEFWGNNDFHMIQFKFLNCKNSTENNNKCASQKEIDEYLGYTEISIFYIDTLVQTNNYKNPLIKGIKEKFYYLSNQNRLAVTRYLHHVTVLSDDGLLFSTNNSHSTFKDDGFIDSTIKADDDTYFFDFSIELNSIGEYYLRKYYKLQDLFSQVGGIYKIATIAGYILTALFSENSYYLYLINSFYRIDVKRTYGKNKKKQNINNMNNNINNTLVIPNQSRILSEYSEKSFKKKPKVTLATENNVMLTFINNKKKIDKKDSLQNKQKEKIKLSFFDKLICLSLCPYQSSANKNKVAKPYFIGKRNISNFLEVENALRNFYDTKNLIKLFIDDKKLKKFYDLFAPTLTYYEITSEFNEFSDKMALKNLFLGSFKTYEKSTLDETVKNEPISKRKASNKTIKSYRDYEKHTDKIKSISTSSSKKNKMNNSQIYQKSKSKSKK